MYTKTVLYSSWKSLVSEMVYQQYWTKDNVVCTIMCIKWAKNIYLPTQQSLTIIKGKIAYDLCPSRRERPLDPYWFRRIPYSYTWEIVL